MLSIRRGTIDDVGLLAGLSARTFHDAYVATAPAADLLLHMGRAFGPAQQRAELADTTLVTLLAEVDGEPVGFAQVRVAEGHPAPPCVPAGRAIEIARFYLEQAWTGRGVAQPLMEAVLGWGRAAGGEVAWLTVWGQNGRAIRFYEKCGFVHLGEAPFRFADRIEQDWVMVRSISAGTAVQS